MTTRTMSSEKARIAWRTLLDLASLGNTDVVIERHGVPTAVLISYETYQQIKPALKDVREGLAAAQRGKRMASLLEEISRLPERSQIKDPVAWQIRQRQERYLADRDKDAD